jgi:hypothetical protein
VYGSRRRPASLSIVSRLGRILLGRGVLLERGAAPFSLPIVSQTWLPALEASTSTSGRRPVSTGRRFAFPGRVQSVSH